MTPTLAFQDVTKAYPGGDRPAVEGVSFTVETGSIVALVGESGSGKTTLLRLAAGLEAPDRGRIEIAGRVVADESCWVPPEKREAGFVFQDGALFPHLTAAGNVAYGLRGKSRKQKRTAVDYLLAMVGLGGYRDRYPHALSGGERQRLALARALAPQPAFILLDEPFSSLDPSLRRSLREEVRDILRKMKATAILVTHDPGDALAMAERMIVLRNGGIEQEGAPVAIYREPKNGYCARLFGPSNRVRINGSPSIWVRPEHLRLTSFRPEGTAFPVRIRRICDTGRHREVTVESQTSGEGERWTVIVQDSDEWNEGSDGWVSIRNSAMS